MLNEEMIEYADKEAKKYKSSRSSWINTLILIEMMEYASIKNLEAMNKEVEKNPNMSKEEYTEVIRKICKFP